MCIILRYKIIIILLPRYYTNVTIMLQKLYYVIIHVFFRT